MQNTQAFASYRASPSASNVLNATPTKSISNDSIDESLAMNWRSKPAEWSDDVRMNALFAPFRNRDLNPLHYDNKLKFWKELISSYCKEKNIIQFDLSRIESSFVRQNAKPKCLELVLNEMTKDGALITKEEALAPKKGILQNAFNKLVWSPLAWSTSYLIKQTPLSFYFYSDKSTSLTTTAATLDASPSKPTTLPASPLSSIRREGATYDKVYVLIELVESFSALLLKQLQTHVVYRNVDCVVEYEHACELAKESFDCISDNDIELLIKYLEANQKVLILENAIENKKLIKFTNNANQNVEKLTEIELSYLKLKETESKLERDYESAHKQIDELNGSIKALLKQNNKAAAMKSLKKRKQLEKSLEQKEGAISNIQAMIMNIQQADTNKLTYDVYSHGNQALKEANKGMSVDKIDDTIDELHDMMSTNAEIEDALNRSPAASKYVYDEDELNTELNELISNDNNKYSNEKQREAENSFNMQNVLESLPNVPQAMPNRVEKLANASFSQ
jgi:hypothetical protein